MKYNGKRSESPSWRGYGEIGNSYLTAIKHLAKRKNLTFDISLRQIWNLFLKQNRKCALSGLKLKFPSAWHSGDGTASLDRIDSSKGYTKQNIQWLHKEINELKSDFPENEFINWCKIIAKYNKLRNQTT